MAAATTDVITLCGAAGYGVVLIESVGVGQSEVEVSLQRKCTVLPAFGHGLT